MGHNSTKAYFIYKGNIVANHISYIGGKVITDVMAKTYNISEQEAEIYKHNNCFVLTAAQFAEVDTSQQEFAKLMKNTLTPLLLDIKRWEVGFRVKYLHAVQTIYVMGGSSNIINIEKFLAEELSCNVEKIDVFKDHKRTILPFDKKQNSSFMLAEVMAFSQSTKRPLLNFLKGNYSSSFDNSIPLHSTIFIATRLLIVALILLLSLVFERFFLNKDLTEQTTNYKIIHQFRTTTENKTI
jgi:hypothetical protein